MFNTCRRIPPLSKPVDTKYDDTNVMWFNGILSCPGDLPRHVETIRILECILGILPLRWLLKRLFFSVGTKMAEALLSPCKELFFSFSAGYPHIATQCDPGTVHLSLECDPDYTVVVNRGICVRVTACNAFDTSLVESCNGNKVSEGVFGQLPWFVNIFICSYCHMFIIAHIITCLKVKFTEDHKYVN